MNGKKPLCLYFFSVFSRSLSASLSQSKTDTDTMVKEQANWSPYDNNGGYSLSLSVCICVGLLYVCLLIALNCRTVVAIAGADYCVIASDTRMSTGYSILTRDYSKICKLYAPPLILLITYRTSLPFCLFVCLFWLISNCIVGWILQLR